MSSFKNGKKKKRQKISETFLKQKFFFQCTFDDKCKQEKLSINMKRTKNT